MFFPEGEDSHDAFIFHIVEGSFNPERIIHPADNAHPGISLLTDYFHVCFFLLVFFGKSKITAAIFLFEGDIVDLDWQFT